MDKGLLFLSFNMPLSCLCVKRILKNACPIASDSGNDRCGFMVATSPKLTQVLPFCLKGPISCLTPPHGIKTGGSQKRPMIGTNLQRTRLRKGVLSGVLIWFLWTTFAQSPTEPHRGRLSAAVQNDRIYYNGRLI